MQLITWKNFNLIKHSEYNDSIEDHLTEALSKADLIRGSDTKRLGKIGWKRVSRTDKGVHARLNAVSAKLNVKTDYLVDGLSSKKENYDKPSFRAGIDEEKMVAAINDHLPQDKLQILGKISKFNHLGRTSHIFDKSIISSIF